MDVNAAILLQYMLMMETSPFSLQDESTIFMEMFSD
jgi:hypothetical protein